jgi:general secretion pathway protein D
MTVKTIFLTLFLTCFGVLGQTPPAPAVSSNAPATATNSHALTNRQEMLRQAMRRAGTNGTNIAPLRANPGVAAATNQEDMLRQMMRRASMTNSTNVTLFQPVPHPASASPAATPAATPMAGSPALPAPARPVLAPIPPTIPPGAAQPIPSGTAVPTPHPATEELLPPGMIDFRGADLKQVLDIYSLMVNRTVLRPANLPTPTIDLKTQGKLTMSEGIMALKAVLQLNGIGMVDVGDKFVKVVPQPQLNQEGAPFSKENAGELPEMGQYITHVVQLKYTKPSEMVPILQPFAKLPNAILPVETSQILVLRDNTENVKRMLEMIEKIDINVPAEFISEVIPIKYALSSDIASALNSLSSSGGGGTSVGTRGSTGGGTRSSSGFGRSGTMGGGMGGMGGLGSSGYPGSTGMNSGFGGTQQTAQGATTGVGAGSSFTSRLQNIISKAATSGEIQVLGQTKIISDERTNSLLVWASREDMKMIKDIVSKLDIVLAQVLIEAVVIQVSLDNSHNLGVSYAQPTASSAGKFTGQGAGGAGNFLSPGSFNSVGSGATNAASGMSGGFNYLLSYGQDLDVTVTALEANSSAKILQRPRIQTSNAKQASLFVGESRPYPTGSYYGGGSYGGYSSIQQMQIGVSIDVTPLINVDGLVVMDIHQKIDSVAGTVNIANVGDVPITSSKEAQASVAVRDHDTIMLGGLIETDKSKSKSGVPLLMDVPLLGYLFRSSTASETRNELIVLIRPTVLPTPEVAALTATAEKNKMPGVHSTEREFQAEDAKRLKQADKQFEQKDPAPEHFSNP